MTEELEICSTKFNKIAGSGTRVLELLKALTKGPLTPTDLLKVVEETSDNVYRQEVVSKYLNTLKLIGFKIIKIKNKYHLIQSIDKIDFTSTDLSLLKFIETYTKNINSIDLCDNISQLLQTVEKSFSNKTRKIIEEKQIKAYKPKIKTFKKNSNINQFDKYCKEGLKLEIEYSIDKKTITKHKIAPLKIMYKNSTAILVAYDYQNCTYKEFILEFITHTVQTPQKQSSEFATTITFKLKNRLAKAYVLKNGEKVLEYGKNYIIISNQKEDRNMIIRRLARYFDNCEILYPKECRQQMKNYIEETQKLYQQ